MPPRTDSPEQDDDETVDPSAGRGAPFTPHERRELRGIMDRDSKARWLASTIRAWGAWLAAVLVGIMAFSEHVKKALRDWLT